jgi:hypothetical protein
MLYLEKGKWRLKELIVIVPNLKPHDLSKKLAKTNK